MNQRITAPATARPRRVLHGLVLLLPLAGLLKTAPASLLPYAAISARGERSSEPYLRATQPASLRFQEAELSPSDPVVRPATVASTPTPVVAGPAASTHNDPSPAITTSPPADTSAESEPAALPPPAILPDETHPKVEAADFLPFFQFPGSASGSGDVTVIAPIPDSQHSPNQPLPSSATYHKQ